MTMVLTIGRRHRSSHETLAECSAEYCRIRDLSGEGASTFPDGVVKFDGSKLHVSYNGRIWASPKWMPGMTPIYG